MPTLHEHREALITYLQKEGFLTKLNTQQFTDNLIQQSDGNNRYYLTSEILKALPGCRRLTKKRQVQLKQWLHAARARIKLPRSVVQALIDISEDFLQPEVDDWHQSTNADVDMGMKFLLNGARFVYSRFMQEQLEATDEATTYVRVVPTGSTKLTSDIDMQVMLNLCLPKPLTELERLVENICQVLRQGAQMWHVNDLAQTIDINIYPPTLINFVQGECQLPVERVYKNHGQTCFRPQLDTLALRKDFVIRDTKHLFQGVETKTWQYYREYKEHVAKKLIATIEQLSQPQDRVNGFSWNSRLFQLVEYNVHAPEVYLSISSIIFVVGYMQMGLEISDDDLKALGVVAYLENKIMFRRTNKDKYKVRYMAAYDKLDQDLLKWVFKHRNSKKIKAMVNPRSPTRTPRSRARQESRKERTD
jgi:hypothetical protein